MKIIFRECLNYKQFTHKSLSQINRRESVIVKRTASLKGREQKVYSTQIRVDFLLVNLFFS